MVKVFKCHSFASQCVIPVKKEPLAIYADGDKVFVATSDCEILVFQVRDGAYTEIHQCVTISPVDQLVYNRFRNYIVTVELKKSWTRVTRSVRVYLNWEFTVKDDLKPRTKVRMAGKSHVQHLSATGNTEFLDIVEVPVDGNATCIDVCRLTGNFALACGSEVKLCSVIEKTVGTSSKIYLDVEVILELCWNFHVISISLCEEFVVCCSQKEVHGIKVRYEEGDGNNRMMKKNPNSPSLSQHSGGDSTSVSSNDPLDVRGNMGGESPASQISETIPISNLGRIRSSSIKLSANQGHGSFGYKNDSRDGTPIARDFSSIGMVPSQRNSPKPSVANVYDVGESQIMDDENFIEWEFFSVGKELAANTVHLPGLHSSTTQSHGHQHASFISPPVLSHFLGGKGKSSAGFEAETVIHLSDASGQDEWMSVSLIATHRRDPSTMLHMNISSTDRMRSGSSSGRTSICCFISGTRGGYLYQLWPVVVKTSVYKYTNFASQIGLGQSFLYAVTSTGIETYTSRWGAVSIDMQAKIEKDLHLGSAHPDPKLDICLIGHQPFLGAVRLSVGTDFLALLAKVEDKTGKEDTLWSLYILSSFSLQDQFRDMLAFAEKMQEKGPASYLHLLQEAHLLVSTHPSHTLAHDENVTQCLSDVNRLLGNFYSQPGVEDWWMCQPFYTDSGAALADIINFALNYSENEKKSQHIFGKGLIQYLDHVLCSSDEVEELNASLSDSVLNVFAVAAPEKLSNIILLSNLKNFTPEKALHHLKTWLSVKASAAQIISVEDNLALVKLHLLLCDVDLASNGLKAIPRGPLVSLCAGHPGLVHQGLKAFTALGQLMRQHLAPVLLDVLVEMLDQGTLALDSLLQLLKTSEDDNIHWNNHIMEVLELILCDENRGFLFESVTQMLCEIYVTRISAKTQQQLNMKRVGQKKFVMPFRDGHFSRRFGWLDYLPPFHSPEQMTRPCQFLEVKVIAGQGLRANATKPVNIASRASEQRQCACCLCNESLLKLQSLLCSPCLSADLASHVFSLVDSLEQDMWVSVKLLCQTKLDLPQATEQLIARFPGVAANYASCCFEGDFDKYSHLLRCLESEIKLSNKDNSTETKSTGKTEDYIRAYKELLDKLAGLFTPSQFVRLLPEDGNLFFLLPFLCTNLKTGHTDRLKQVVVNMGKELLYQH